MNIKEETRFLLDKYNIRINKNFGQNFLVNDDIINKIIDSAEISEEDLVIEIGPGLGTLTKNLLEKANKVIAIELDSNMINVITDRFNMYDNLIVINEDILKVDLESIIKNYKGNGKVKVVANLPYYISTPIIIKLLQARLSIDEITVMVQKEVAQRISSATGSKLCGSITYIVDYYAEATEIINVSKDDFIPSPKVDSEVIKLKIRNVPKVFVDNEDMFFNIIKMSFSQRRKTLVNVLTNFGFVSSKDEAVRILKNLNIREDTRGESLTLEQFAMIQKAINWNVAP